MANARPGYKRIMGEIPDEMHAKITMYNKISDRPLNVSRAIELCMEQAVRKIDNELIAYAEEGEGGSAIISDRYYKALSKDVKDGSLSSMAIHKHLVQMLNLEGIEVHDFAIRMILYPIDKVKLDDKSGNILFYAGDVRCFAVCPSNSNEESIWDSNLQATLFFERP